MEIIFKLFSLNSVIIVLILLYLALFRIILKNKGMKEKNKLILANEEFIKAQTIYRDMFYKSQVIMLLVESDTGKIMAGNNAACEFHGYTIEQLKDLKLTAINSFEQENTSQKMTLLFTNIEQSAINKAFDTTCSVHNIEVSIKGRDNLLHTAIFSAEPINVGDTPCWLTTMTDITNRKEVEEELIKSEQKYKLLFSELNDAFSHQKIICDEHGKPIDYRFITINPSFEKMTGLKSEDIIGKTVNEVMPNTEKSLIEIYGNVALTGESVHFNTFSEELNKYYEVKVYRPSLEEFATIFMDITERVKSEKDVLYLNYHDVLTGLYNRRFYEEEISRLNTERNLPISIIMGDVNGLKLVNDAFGHAKGDELLQKAAKAIKRACRTDDIIARWGGDEFIILLPKTKIEEAEEIVNRIIDMYSKDHVNAISGSISFGWDTKSNMNEDILKTLKNAEDQMYNHKTLESECIRRNTISTIITNLHEKKPCEEQHSKKVGDLCRKIGKAIGLSEIEVRRVKGAGFFHDIGKISIDEGILDKPGKLTDQEWDVIKRHPDIGFRILSSSHEMSELADYILAHHERWDGTGYPKGLKEGVIPLEARIIALADSYDAMTTERSYRKAMSEEEALHEIRKNAGTQFDPEIARIFVEEVMA